MKARVNNRQKNQSFLTFPIVTAMAAASFAQPALAVDRTWVGDTGDWGIATNWSPAGAPGSSDKAIIIGGNITLPFNTSVASWEFTAGELGGTGDLSVIGSSIWTGGSIGGAGTTQFAGHLSITGDSIKAIEGGRVVSVSDTTWSNDAAPNTYLILFRSGGGTINNTGTWSDKTEFDASMALDSYGTPSNFNNIGTYNKQGSGTTSIAATYSNIGTTNVDAGKMRIGGFFSNSGVIAVDAASTFQVLDVIVAGVGGIKNVSAFENVASGVVRGAGTVITPERGLTNHGAINPGDPVGRLSVDGDLHQSPGGVLNIELASLSSFDQLAVTDGVTLGGELAVSNLGYTPAIGDSFIVATFGERLASSTFSSVSMDGFGPGVNLDVIYNDHDVTLAVTAVPEPESWSILLAGLGLVGALVRRRRPRHRAKSQKSVPLI